MYVIPMVGVPNGIIYLVYLPAGTGHYDADIPCSYTVTKPKFTNTDFKPLHLKTRCSCRVNTTKLKHLIDPILVMLHDANVITKDYHVILCICV